MRIAPWNITQRPGQTWTLATSSAILFGPTAADCNQTRRTGEIKR
jgi:hypothetical protein